MGILALLLFVLMGVVVGTLGGGGSVMTIPILIYIVGLGTKEAIATSLLVLGMTSFVATILHGRAGNVNWKVGSIFGAVAMVGAYGGGRAAALFPGEYLLIFFSVLLVGSGLAILTRGKRIDTLSETPPEVHWTSGLWGLLVGAVTGLVGAGGGFLIVPALALFAGLSMRQAIGTSLFVITLNSVAGLAGQMSHLSIDVPMALGMGGASIVGTIVGTQLSKKLDASKLRQGFAIFVLVMADIIIYKQLPSMWIDAIFVERWPFWVGGMAIGTFILLFALVGGKQLGISTGYSDVCSLATKHELKSPWRVQFIVGVVLGGLIAAVMGGYWDPHWTMGMFDEVVSGSLLVKAVVFTFGGILLGLGARLAGGCTSGHGIMGMSLLAPSSIISTMTFMGTGYLVTQFIFTGVGG